jgi:hypothetical protein
LDEVSDTIEDGGYKRQCIAHVVLDKGRSDIDQMFAATVSYIRATDSIKYKCPLVDDIVED